MKKIAIVVLLGISLSGKAQNLQLHYDFGSERKYFTATHEMFRPDTLGSTFWFIDFDFDYPGSPRSMSSAYWEIAREFYIPGIKNIPGFEQLALHLEYNDGFGAFQSGQEGEESLAVSTYNSVFLVGLAYPVGIGDFVLSTQLLLRMPRGMTSPGFQFTLVWFQYLWQNRVLLTGYADLWSQDGMDGDQEVVFQTEPQLWFMVLNKIALGGEVEISKNFPFAPNAWEFQPTLGIRWEF